jgi:arsenate reductase (glutaredoxin)
VKLTFYEKPTCTTCRKTAELLAERGIEFERVNYFVEPLGETKLRELLHKAGLRPREAMRANEPIYKDLHLAQSDHTDDQLITLMAMHPELVQRPIVELGERAVLARPPERVLELL